MDEKIGDRIELLYWDDPATHYEDEMIPGLKGTIDHIDDTGTLFVDWDNGCNLGLLPGIDRWKIIEGDK